MELRIYKDLASRSAGKFLFCARVSCPDAFPYEKTIEVFRSIYGSCIIEYLIV